MTTEDHQRYDFVKVSSGTIPVETIVNGVLCRYCRGCGQYKPKDAMHFRIRRASKYGFTARCKDCMKVRDHEYKDENRDAINSFVRMKYWARHDAVMKKKRLYQERFAKRNSNEDSRCRYWTVARSYSDCLD